MIFEPRILFWSLLFFAVLWYAQSQELLFSASGYLVTLVPLLIISSIAGYQLYRRIVRIFVPLVLSAVIPLLLSLIDQRSNALIFMIIGSLMYYFGLLSMYRLRKAPQDQTAQSLLHATLMASIFFFYCAVTGFFLNFAFPPLWFVMIIVGIVTTLVTYVSFLTVSREDQQRNFLYSSLVGFLLTEVFFVASFWPFGYLTTGALLTIGYFLFWEMALDAFLHTLSMRKIFFRIALLGVIILIVLLSTPWRILV